MGSIAVGQSIGGAYGFLFRRFLTILGLSWLPAAIYAFARLAFLWHVEPRLFAEVHGGGHPSFVTILFVLGYVVLALLLVSVIAVALTRDALDLRDQPVLARLVVGPRELRLFAAYISIDIIVIVLVAVLIAGVIGATMGAKWALAQGAPLTSWPVLKIVHIAASVIAVLIVLFVTLRLSFLIAPVAAAEDKARISRAWELSAGNFWRMFVIALAILVPLLIVIVVCEYAVLGPQIMALHHAGARRDPSALLSAAIAHGPVLVTIAAAAMVIANALFAGASAAAYRALVPQPRREAEVYVEPVETQAHIEPYAAPQPAAEEVPHVEDAAPVAEEAPAEEHAHAEEAAPAGHVEHHMEAPAEPSQEVAAPAEEQAMDLLEPVIQEEPHEPPPPEVPEDPGAHVH
jgi:hypothetical protein